MSLDPKIIPDTQQGYYLEYNHTFYTVVVRDPAKENGLLTTDAQIFNVLKNIMGQRNLFDYHKSNLSGSGDKSHLVNPYLPKVMTAKTARQKEAAFEIYFANDLERKRYESFISNGNNKKPLFKK